MTMTDPAPDLDAELAAAFTCEVCEQPIDDLRKAHRSHLAECPVVTDSILRDELDCACQPYLICHDECCRVCAKLTAPPDVEQAAFDATTAELGKVATGA